jgi:hypothetical protein
MIADLLEARFWPTSASDNPETARFNGHQGVSQDLSDRADKNRRYLYIPYLISFFT